MAGKIIADTLEHSTAGSLTTDYVVNGSAKAWVNFNGTGTIATRDSLNVSGLVDNGTGDYTVNYTNSFSTVNYAVSNYTAYQGGLQQLNNRMTGSSNKATGSIRVAVGYVSATDGSLGAEDVSENNYVIYGDLA